MQTVKLSDGDVFSALAIRDTLDALKQLYASHGYIDFVATPITEIDESRHHRVTLMMELDQQKQYRIGRVEINATSPKVRAAINERLKPGEVLDYSVIPKLLKENASLLPPDVSERDVRFGSDRNSVWSTCGSISKRVPHTINSRVAAACPYGCVLRAPTAAKPRIAPITSSMTAGGGTRNL